MEEKKKSIEEMLEALKETKREFGQFAVGMDDNMNVVVEANFGWKMVYPYGTETWALIVNWMDRWDEMSKECIENFVKVIVFPCAIRLIDIDAQYMEDIAMAHIHLNERVAAAKSDDGSEEKNDESADGVGTPAGEAEGNSDEA